MEAILASKLECSKQGMPVTPLSFLRVMSAVSRAAAARLEVPPNTLKVMQLLILIKTTLWAAFLHGFLSLERKK